MKLRYLCVGASSCPCQPQSGSRCLPGCEVDVCPTLRQAQREIAERSYRGVIVKWPLPEPGDPRAMAPLHTQLCGTPLVVLDQNTSGDTPELPQSAHGIPVLHSYNDVRRFFIGKATPVVEEAPNAEVWAGRLIGSSPAMHRIRELIRLLANRRTTVLVTGETGTGKEAVARALSEAGSRRDRPFVALNCAAVPETLFETELFGHAKGAFTGAATARPGLFELADGGTLFLDEIGDMPMHLQGKLLRVLQEREIRRIGESAPLPVDCRVIAASNVDLSAAAREKRFREDLLYRLSVVKVNVPPLRTRLEDVPALVRHFLNSVCLREQLELRNITDQALAHLTAHAWPGNIRQLEHAVESAIVLAGDRRLLEYSDFPLEGHEPALVEANQELRPMSEAGVDLEDMVRRLQLHYLNQALQLSGGNKSRAADLLGLRRTTLLYKARQLGCVVRD